MISSRHFGNVSVCTNCELILVFRHTPQNFWPIRGRNWSEATQSSMNFQSIICPITYHSQHPRVWIHDHKNPHFLFIGHYFLSITRKNYFSENTTKLFQLPRWPLHHHSPQPTSSSLITSTLFTTISITFSKLFVWSLV